MANETVFINGGSVDVAADSGLTGDGSTNSPLEVAVDGVTVTIVNGALTAPAGGGGTIGGTLGATTNVVPRSSGVGGATLQASALVISDAAAASGLKSLSMAGATSGTTVLIPTAIAGTTTLTMPAATDTLVGKATTDTLTNKTLTAPTMTTPTLGVASATSVNKVAITAPATSATLTIADGKTLTSNVTVTVAGTDGKTLELNTSLTVPADPNADRMLFWDDSASATDWLIPGNSVAITVKTLDTIQDIRTTATPTFATATLSDGLNVNLGDATVRSSAIDVLTSADFYFARMVNDNYSVNLDNGLLLWQGNTGISHVDFPTSIEFNSAVSIGTVVDLNIEVVFHDVISGVAEFTGTVAIGQTDPAQQLAKLELYRDANVPASLVNVARILGTSTSDNTTFAGLTGLKVQIDDAPGVDASTKGVLYGVQITMAPNVTRNNVPVDDVAGLIVQNDGLRKGTDAIYIGAGVNNLDAVDWATAIEIQTDATNGIRLMGTYTEAAIYALGRIQAQVFLSNEMLFANLPASPIVGMIASIANSTTAVWGATITGGGTDHVLAFYNGSNWTVIGK